MIFWLCYDATHQDGRVWGVRLGNKWHRSASVGVFVPMATVYKRKGKQPKAYLRGYTTKTHIANHNTLIF